MIEEIFQELSPFLKIYNSEFIRNIYDSHGKEEYRIEIKSDFAKWFKNENTLVFSSNDKQIETTIKFLTTKLNE